MFQWYRKHPKEKRVYFFQKTDETSKLEEHVLSEKLSIPEETSFDQVLYWENEAKVTATPPLKFVNKY